jgi:hypothetical protein
MADTVTEQWLYPPNWDGNVPTRGGWDRVVKKITCVSDGTGETDVVKVDISELRTRFGKVPTRTSIQKILYSVSGFSSVILKWDRAPNSTICVMAGTDGCFNWKKTGGLPDPSSGGDRTGNILLTSNGASSGDVYDITIELKLKE